MKTLSINSGDLLELDILKITPNGGRGLARHEGFVVFVPFTVPGDRVKVRITKVKKSFAEARLEEVITPSKIRITPECRYFGECGGCTLQMTPVQEQEKIKSGFIEDMLFKLQVDKDGVLKPLVSSKKVFRYRNRIQLHQSGDKLGYFQKKSHRLIPIEDCLIADERITEEFERLRSENKKRRFEVALTKEGVVVTRDKSSKNPKKTLFSQVNEDVNQRMLDNLEDLIRSKSWKEKRALDLYAGSGNFSSILLKYFQEVTAVEMSKSSIKTAKESLKGVKFVCDSVESYLSKNSEGFDFVLADPPRFGMDKKAIEFLLKMRPEKIIYISCNPATLERDLKLMLELYRIDQITPFDMFPQTSHVEVVSSLIRL